MRRESQGDTGRERRRRERLIALTLLGVLLFNYPFLSLFGSGATFLGLPLLYLYVFLAWGLFLWLVARILDSGSADTSDDPDPQD